MDIDVSQVLAAAAEFEVKGAAVEKAVEPVMKRAAQNIKDGMQREFLASEHFKGVARKGRISYDRTGLLTGSLQYEIGPEIGGGGSLAGIAVEGGANGGGGTVDVDKVGEAEAPRLENEISVALGILL